MDSRNRQSKEQGDCFGNSSCCSPKPTAGAQKPSCCGAGVRPSENSHRVWGLKTFIFIGVMTAAIAAAAWSLTKAHRTEVDAEAQGQHEERLSLQRMSGDELVSSFSLDAVAPDKDFAFVLLAGADPQATIAATRAIEETVETLLRNGVGAQAIAIERNDPDLKRIVETVDVEGLPAVLLLGRDGEPGVVTGEITTDDLLRGYVLITCGPGCGPGAAGSGCCP